jgi:hypothetical protein
LERGFIWRGVSFLLKIMKRVKDGKDGKMEMEIDVSFSYAFFNSGAPLVIDLKFHF